MNIRKPHSLVPAAFCAAWLFVLQPTMAAVDDDETYDAGDALPDLSEVREHLLEEIVVVGEKTTIQLRREIRAADMVVFDTFNELNADDEYDIVCRKQTRIGSQVVRMKCKARMFWEAQSELAEEDSAVSTIQPLSNRRKHERILHEKVRALASTNPNLLKVMLRREILKRELENRKEQQQSEE